MKKKLVIKFAAFMVALTNVTANMMKAPNSLLLWGEPTQPMQKDAK